MNQTKLNEKKETHQNSIEIDWCITELTIRYKTRHR